MTIESVALPTNAEGRPVITATMVVEHPHLMDMIERQSNYWKRNPQGDYWVGPLPESEEK